MSDTQQVASGNSPQPAAEVAENHNLTDDVIQDQADEIVGEDAAAPEGEEGADLSSEEGIEAAQAAGDISKKEAANLKKKLKIKVDGQEEDVEIDLGDEEALKKEIQKSRAFDKRSKEWSTYKNNMEKFLEEFQKNPEAILEKMGHNVDEMAEKRLQRRIEEMQKSPEQLEREKMQKELEDLRKEKTRIEEEKQRAEQEKLRNMYATELENDIMKGLEESKAKLPKNNPRIYAYIANTMLLAMQNGYSDVKVADVIPLVERQWKEEMKSYFDSSTEDLIEELVGKTNLERLRQKRLSKRPKAQTTTAKQAVKDTGSNKQEDKAKEPKRMKDIFSLID